MASPRLSIRTLRASKVEKPSVSPLSNAATFNPGGGSDEFVEVDMTSTKEEEEKGSNSEVKVEKGAGFVIKVAVGQPPKGKSSFGSCMSEGYDPS